MIKSICICVLGDIGDIYKILEELVIGGYESIDLI